MNCIFFGHRDCDDLNSERLRNAIENMIRQGVYTFYVGHQGRFDQTVFASLLQLKEIYPQIEISVVLAYLPTQKSECDLYHGYSIYPEGIELGLPKFAIERRNKWMIDRADYCLCWIDHTWGGAYKFVQMAKRRGVMIMNLGRADL